jgi:hypothetical protein
LGFSIEFEVYSSGGQDITPPELVDFHFTSDTMIDISNQEQELYYSLSMIDDLSGLNFCTVYSISPSGSNQVYYSHNFNGELEITDTGILNIPQNVETGLWEINYISCRDIVNNMISFSGSYLEELGFSIEFEVFIYDDNQSNLGDINEDGLINVVDVVTMVNIIINDGEYNYLGDINEDGLINVVDIVSLVSIILNI